MPDTYRIQIQVANMPVFIVLQSTGEIAFLRQAGKWIIFDDEAIFCDEFFSIGSERYAYNQMYEYKTIQPMLEYLQKQCLQQPY